MQPDRFEQYLSEALSQLCDARLPEPSVDRLLQLEQALPLGQKKARTRFMPLWLILLLALTGVASAFWLVNVARDRTVPVPPVQESRPAQNEDHSRPEPQKGSEQADGEVHEGPPAVIYRREVLGNE